MSEQPSVSTERPSTRSSISEETTCPFFGEPRELPIDRLPTKADIILEFRRLQTELGSVNNNEIVERVSKSVENVWLKLFDGKVITKNFKYIKLQVNELYKPPQSRKNNVTGYSDNLNLFRSNSRKGMLPKKNLAKFSDYIQSGKELFDIGICPASKVLNQIDCDCETCKSLCNKERQFLHDCRHPALKGDNYQQSSINPQRASASEQVGDTISQSSSEDANSSDNNQSSGSSYELDPTDSELQPGNNMMSITSTTITAIATHSSDAQTADMLESVQFDLKFNNQPIEFHAFNRSKVHRWKEFIRNVFLERQRIELQSKPIISLLYDSKLEDQMVYNKNEREFFSRTTERQDHYTIVIQPENIFATSISIIKEVCILLKCNNFLKFIF